MTPSTRASAVFTVPDESHLSDCHCAHYVMIRRCLHGVTPKSTCRSVIRNRCHMDALLAHAIRNRVSIIKYRPVFGNYCSSSSQTNNSTMAKLVIRFASLLPLLPVVVLVHCMCFLSSFLRHFCVSRYSSHLILAVDFLSFSSTWLFTVHRDHLSYVPHAVFINDPTIFYSCQFFL